MELNEFIRTLYIFDLKYCGDSVEWCPHEPNQNVFVCGNYQLVENEKSANDATPIKRLGRILLFSIMPENGLKLHQTIESSAILDQKWCHKKIYDYSILGVANAAKRVEIYKLDERALKLDIVTFYEIDTDISETLVLSLDWSVAIFQADEPEIVCSDSKGNIHLLKLTNKELVLHESRHGHDFEAWISGFYYWDPNIFFSGGDDSIFLKFDKRMGKQAIAKNRSHSAGVTTLHSNSSIEYVLVTGSYDEHIRLWDIRNMKNESVSIKMPGPLWRLKWDPFCQKKLLAACMLGGIHIVDVEINKQMKIVGSYYEHKSISYGADWSFLNEERCNRFDEIGDIILCTCSFYDRLLCVSKFFNKKIIDV